MQINLVAEGLKYMVLGMGVVFAFLALLVGVMKGQARLIAAWAPPTTPPVSPPASESTDEADEASRVAAIVAAVQAFRRDQLLA